MYYSLAFNRMMFYGLNLVFGLEFIFFPEILNKLKIFRVFIGVILVFISLFISFSALKYLLVATGKLVS